jgi:hypothetical protein
MGLPIFLKEMPETQFDRGHVSATVGEMEFIATMCLYGAFLERECAKYCEWVRENGLEADIVKLSERGALFLREGNG